jgi:hypothetical protein
MTDLTTDDGIADLANRALDYSLPKSEWTHKGHFAFALWCTRNRPDLAGPESFRRIIMKLNEAHGTPNSDSEGYHHTITVASLRAANSMHDRAMSLPDNLALLMDSKFGGFDWIFEYWSKDRLFGVDARRGWVEPDLKPMPF